MLCYERGGELAGVLPVVLESGRTGGVPVRSVEFLTVPDTQVCDVLVRQEQKVAAVEAFADELSRRQAEWDVMRLRCLPPDSTTVTALVPALVRRGFIARTIESSPNPFVPLGSSWDAFYATRSRSLKKANNLAANRLRKAGDVRIDWLEPGRGNDAQLERCIETIIDVSARSWKTRTENSLDNAGPQAFIRRLSRLAHSRGSLSVWTMSLDGRPLAMEFQLVADGNAYALRSDFDAGCDELSPGSHLGRHLLEQLFGRNLNRYYMGPGENAYKYRWTEQSEPTYEVAVYSRSARGRLLAAWQLSLKPAARRLRDRFVKPPPAPPVSGDQDQTS